MSKTERGGLSQRVAAAVAEIERLAKAVAPTARTVNFPMREFYSCTIVVTTDEEKRRINDDAVLLNEMRDRAAAVGRRPDYLSAESQETVDRRYNGDWNYIWR